MCKTHRLFVGLLKFAFVSGLFFALAGDASVTTPDLWSPLVGTPNPAAVYCTTLGYNYEIQNDGQEQAGICRFSDGTSCEAWRFLQGQCGQEKNACSQLGYQTQVSSDGKNQYSSEYAVCVENDGRRLGSATDLMGFDRNLASPGCPKEPSLPNLHVQAVTAPIPLSIDQAQALPSSFDWRDYQGGDWTTPIKDQGVCGSCWAFAAMGSAEAALNIGYGIPDLDVDLSEQYVVSDCMSNGNCCGGFHTYPLEFMRDFGIPDEGCLPYVDGNGCSCSPADVCSTCNYVGGDFGACSDTTCSDRCQDWASRLRTLDYVNYVPADTTSIKQALVNYGPMATVIGMNGNFDGNIYRCEDDGGANHSVVLVGYNDSPGYWIVRNSWGIGWNGDGYFFVGYDECNISSMTYLPVANYQSPPSAFQKISPEDGLLDTGLNLSFTWLPSLATSTYEFCIDGTNNYQCDRDWSDIGLYTMTTAQDLTPGQPYFWQVRARNANSVTEADGGNWWQITTKADWPDLVIESLTASPANPAKDQPILITAQIKNQGSGASPVAYLDFFFDSQPTICEMPGMYWVAIDPLEPGESREFVYEIPGFSTSGDHQIWAMIDAECDMQESDENNNIFGPILIKVGEDTGLIFQDGFESGNFSSWSQCYQDVDDLRVRRISALVGEYGLWAHLDDNAPIYCTVTHSLNEKTYRARFYFDPNSISMVNGNTHVIFQGYGNGRRVLRIDFRRNLAQYQIRTAVLTDAATWKLGNWVNIQDNPQWFEFSWKASRAAGMNNGLVTLWVDGIKRTSITGIDNDLQRIKRIQLGAVLGIDTGTRGAYFFDDYVARRDNQLIGPAVASGTETEIR